MLKNYYNNYKQTANIISNWETLTKEDLVNKYCYYDENGDSNLSNAYLSAIICKYWYMLYEIKKNCLSLNYEDEDYLSMLMEVFIGPYGVFKYKAWLKKDISIEKCINRTFYSVQKRHYFKSNLYKMRVNYNLTLDEMDNYSKDYINYKYEDDIKKIINSLLKTDVIKGFIINGIINEKTSKNLKLDFNMLYKYLKRINRTPYKKIIEKIKISRGQFNKFHTQMKDLKDKNYIKKHLEELKNNKLIRCLL